MSETLSPLLLCALLLPLEAAVLPALGLSTARADLVLCAVVYLSVGGVATLAGAAAAVVIGLVADLLTPVHPGLFALSSVMVFLLIRVSPLGREVRGPLSFMVVMGLAAVVHQLVVAGLLFLVGQRLPESLAWPIAQSAIFTALVAPAFYWLASQLDKFSNREDTSLLR